MIKKLQKKFIFSAMLAVTILLIILLGAINTANAYSSKIQNERMLDNLLISETAPPHDNNDNNNNNHKEPKKSSLPPAEEKAKIPSVYFKIRTDNSDNITSVEISHINNITEDEAKEIFSKIDSRNDNGTVQNFRYKYTVNTPDSSKTYFFLDTTIQNNTIIRVLVLSVIIGFAAWTAMLLLIIMLSKKAIRPIAENIERQKQFVTNAGHEIKTPLAIIMSNAEAMELYNGENKWSKNIKEQVKRLNGLMQNLLTLSKLDEKNTAYSKEIISLSEITEKTINMFSENAELKNITIEKMIEKNIVCNTSEELYSMLISILIDNAIKYSQKNEKIEITLKQNTKSIVFETKNNCETLPQCPANRLFDRFYRADTARTQKDGGYGIGLSAAKSIVSSLGGSIHCEYKNKNTIIFSVKI